MIQRFPPLIHRWLARIWPSQFSHLYSTLNDPIIVPVQAAAYKLTLDRYLGSGDSVLDVGFGLGYGLEILSRKAYSLTGVDIDPGAVARAQSLANDIPSIQEARHYNGQFIPYPSKFFDLVTCIDVLEHVPDYPGLLVEMIRVAKRCVIISTPNRRPENTRPNGKPRNRWHLREWSPNELDKILQHLKGVHVRWHYLDGPWEGPFTISDSPGENTLALTPVLLVRQ